VLRICRRLRKESFHDSEKDNPTEIIEAHLAKMNVKLAREAIPEAGAWMLS